MAQCKYCNDTKQLFLPDGGVDECFYCKDFPPTEPSKTINMENELEKLNTIKPIKAKPIFYAHCFYNLKEIAKDYGYNLVLHGSMDRDMDLIAIPWVNEPKSHIELLNAFCKYLNVPIPISEDGYMFSILEGGRSSYIINLNRGGRFNGWKDEQYYLDISITPVIVAPL